MSFIEVPGPHYIKRTLVFVNSNKSDPIRSTSNYDFSFNLVEEIQNVFSIELLNFTVPRLLTPALLGTFDEFNVHKTGVVTLIPQNSNMRYDIKISDETRANSLIIEGSLDPGFYFAGQIAWSGVSINTGGLALAWLFDFNARFLIDVASSPVFGGGKYALGFLLNQNDQLGIFLENTVAVPTTYGFVDILFGTGPNKDSQMSIPLGFKPFVDQISDTSQPQNALLAPFRINPNQFTYIDVFLAQAAENSPWARIYTIDELLRYTAPKTVASRSRMMKTPVQNLKFLDFRIRAQGGRILGELSNTGMDMTIEVLSIAQVPNVPDWVKQRLEL